MFSECHQAIACQRLTWRRLRLGKQKAIRPSESLRSV
jgi:hypothetical protein